MSSPLLESPARPEVAARVARQDVRVVSARQNVPARVNEIWRYRQLLLSLVRKELKVKYKDSVLGFAWSMLNPLLYLTVYYVVFTYFLRNNIPLFPVFLVCGLLIWNLFSGALAAATGSVVGNGAIVKKVSFPREVLPLASVGAAVFNFFLQLIILCGALLVFTHAPAWQYLPMVIPAFVAVVLLASALGIFLAAVNVKFRDTQHLLELVLLFWFWMTPIVYPFRYASDHLAEKGIEWIYLLNPITSVVLVFQRAIYAFIEPVVDGERMAILPDESAWWYLGHVGIVIGISAAFLYAALAVFARLEGNFAEEL